MVLKETERTAIKPKNTGKKLCRKVPEIRTAGD